MLDIERLSKLSDCYEVVIFENKIISVWSVLAIFFLVGLGAVGA